MLCAELINSCSHDKVAEAAVLSIGGDFNKRVAMLARASNMTPGRFAAQYVRRFSEEAQDEDWDALAAVIAGCDTPILHGLRWLVETMLDEDVQGVRSLAKTQGHRGGPVRQGLGLGMLCI